MAEVIRLESVKALRKQVALWRSEGRRIGLVPTMGGLHAGHLSLIKAALVACDRVVTTIFVNPTQFGAGEDLEAYPRDTDRDVALIADCGGHAAFLPSVAEVYPEGFSTRVIVDGLTEVLCGLSRPGHFDGVSQVVTKLLNQARADEAFFGEKDWQQLAVIRRLARDLDIETVISGVPTVRDQAGLALSSRNAYLNDADLAVARAFNVILRKAAAEVAAGAAAQAACTQARAALLDAGFRQVDYVECRGAGDLELVVSFSEEFPARIFGAAHIGRARLIDNHPVEAVTNV